MKVQTFRPRQKIDLEFELMSSEYVAELWP